MSERTGNRPAEATVADVVRSFTDAEVALREMAGAAANLRSAADMLAESRRRLDESDSQTYAITDQMRLQSTQLASVAGSLDAIAQAYFSLRPDQLWQSFQAVREDHESLSREMRQHAADREQRLDLIDAEIAAQSRSVSELKTAVIAVDRRLSRLLVIGISTLGVGVVLLGAILVMLAGGMGAR